MAEFSNITNDTNYTDVFTDILNNTTENITTLVIEKYAKKNGALEILEKIVIILIDIFMVIGPSLGYLIQSLKFKKTKSSKGFSKSICLIVYLSQILRVFFWIGKPFKITLLYQSILIIIFQVYLIYLWILYHNIKPKNNINKNNQVNDKKEIIEYIIDWSDTISPNKIWNWTSTIEYYKFMLFIILILLLICGVVGIHNPILVNIMGTISVITEASTLLPQIVVSCKKKNASNLSMTMVALWSLGECCKLIYNILYKTPIQMILSGAVQIFLDFFCLFQIICYRNSNPHYRTTDEINETMSPIKSSKKVQQINQFMNKLEEKFNEENDNENNKVEQKISFNNNESKKNINKVSVPEKIENSDNVKVLDKTKYNKEQENRDIEEEDNDNKNNLKKEIEEKLDEEIKENEGEDKKETTDDK
jgi:uncharacterized protein with PQ loop repeat